MKIVSNSKYKMLSESNKELDKLIRFLDKNFLDQVKENKISCMEKTVVELAISLLIKYKNVKK